MNSEMSPEWVLVAPGLVIAALGVAIHLGADKIDTWFQSRHPSTTGDLSGNLTVRLRRIAGFGLMAVGALMMLAGLMR